MTAADDKKSAATVLVEMARSRYRFGISTDGEPFAVPIAGSPVARLLRDGRQSLRIELARSYFDTHGRAAAQQALADALCVIEGDAACSDPVVLAQRMAHSSGAYWIDIGDPTGEAIRVDENGWTVAIPPMQFRRTVLNAPLPRPVDGGDLAELWDLLNVAQADQPLLLAWLVAAIMPEIPHPVLALFGEQGTGKSTAAKMLTSLIDPSPAPLRKVPRDADSWVTAASGSWIVTIDNVSTVPPWFSDTLCRAVTGDGDVRRQLYTNAGLAVFAFRRAVILNGIDPGAMRGDLVDRLLVITLDVIADARRRLDAEIEARWRDARGRLLGALLDLAVDVLGRLPSIDLPHLPRMADYTRVLAAVDVVQHTNGVSRYLARQSSLAAESLTAEPFVTALTVQLKEEFVGTSASLLRRIDHGESRAPRDWPRDARALTQLLNRQAPVMRKAGWHIDSAQNRHTKVTAWTIRPPGIGNIPDPQPLHNSPTPSTPAFHSDRRNLRREPIRLASESALRRIAAE